jgi:hypothetical protein
MKKPILSSNIMLVLQRRKQLFGMIMLWMALAPFAHKLEPVAPSVTKSKAQVVYQKMAPSPDRRISQKMKAFEHTGLDFAGSFELEMCICCADRMI